MSSKSILLPLFAALGLAAAPVAWSQPRDAGTPGTPPATAPQRGVDTLPGTAPDGTPGNPPGTALGCALDRVGSMPRATDDTAGAGVGTAAVDGAALRDARRASKVIGASVYNEANESIGEVDDIIIPAGGSAPVAVISVGGFLGIGAKLVAVPYARLTEIERQQRPLGAAGATKDSLTSLPTFRYEERR